MLRKRDNSLERWCTHSVSSAFQDKFRERSDSFFLSPLSRAFHVFALYREFQDRSKCVKPVKCESRFRRSSEHVSSKWLSDRLTLSKSRLLDNADAMYPKPSFPMSQLLRSRIFRIVFSDIASYNFLAPFVPIRQPDSDKSVIVLFLSSKSFRYLHAFEVSLLSYKKMQ